jgi:hypothetical protein
VGYVAAAYILVVAVVFAYALTLTARQRVIDEMAEAAASQGEEGR